MITVLITLLIVGLVLALIFYVCGWFFQGRPLQIVGIILGLIWLLYALKTLNLINI
jgi:hypothetical protein